MRNLLFVVFALAACSKSPDPIPVTQAPPKPVVVADAAPPTMPPSEAAAPEAAVPEEKEVEDGIWVYDTQKDGMGDTIWTAKLVMEMSIFLKKSPYAGAWDATITLTRTNGGPLEMTISSEEGQFDCSAYNACTIKVKVGDSPPKGFQMLKSKKSSNILMVQDPKGFLKAIKDATGFKIELPFFREEKANVVLFLQDGDVKLP